LSFLTFACFRGEVSKSLFVVWTPIDAESKYSWSLSECCQCVRPPIHWIAKDAVFAGSEFPENAHCELYTDVHDRALAKGTSAAMDYLPILYEFWSHYLVRNFDEQMFEEFQRLSKEDEELELGDIGMRNLIKFYDANLRSIWPVRKIVLNGLISLVAWEKQQKNSQAAFECLKSAWKRNDLHPKTRRRIDETLEQKWRIALND